MNNPLDLPITSHIDPDVAKIVLADDDQDSAVTNKRTPGLKAVDAGIYLISDAAVIIGSILLTYLTTEAGKTHAENSTGKWAEFCDWAYHRGIDFKSEIMQGGWFADNVLEKIGSEGIHLDEKQADAWKMVAFSFVDGTVFTLPVWIAEKFRASMARKFDEMCGTLPEDESVYHDPKEKQGMLSLLGGRIATLSIVLPVAVALNKIGTDKSGSWIWNSQAGLEGFNSLNDHVLHNPGMAFGNFLMTHKLIEQFAEKTNINIPELTKVGFFEAVYTTICTGSLYVISRGISSAMSKDQVIDDKNPDSQPTITIAPSMQSALLPASDRDNATTVLPQSNTTYSNVQPETILLQIAHNDRIHHAPQLALN